MSTANRRRLAFLTIILGVLTLCGVIRWTSSAASVRVVCTPDDKPAGQVFQNIQVLKDVPASQLGLAMEFMAASLGVGCDFCHTAALESDEKSTKLTTRKMIVMTADINKQSFSGFSVVNCYTCHRGRTEPGAIPDIDDSTLQPKADSPDPSPKLPSSEQLMAQYETAIGGAPAIDKLTTCIFMGSLTSSGAGRSPATGSIEVYHKAPDRFLYYAILPGGAQRQGFDGKSEWTIPDNKLQSIAVPNLASIARTADFYPYLKLRESFPSFRVLGRERLADRHVIVAGAASQSGLKVKLYFDATTGLLVRRAALIKTPLGMLPDVVDFENYRKVKGIAFPFRIKRYRAPEIVVEDLSEIRLNEPLEESKFTAPERRAR